VKYFCEKKEKIQESIFKTDLDASEKKKTCKIFCWISPEEEEEGMHLSRCGSLRTLVHFLYVFKEC